MLLPPGSSRASATASWSGGSGGAEPGPAGGVATLMLETVGAKSGEPRRAVLGYLPEGDQAWLVIAALAGPLATRPGFRTSPANPTPRSSSTMAVESMSAPRRSRAMTWPGLERIAKEAPEFVGYRSTADREIPVVRLRRR